MKLAILNYNTNEVVIYKVPFLEYDAVEDFITKTLKLNLDECSWLVTDKEIDLSVREVFSDEGDYIEKLYTYIK